MWQEQGGDTRKCSEGHPHVGSPLGWKRKNGKRVLPSNFLTQQLDVPGTPHEGVRGAPRCRQVFPLVFNQLQYYYPE